jgi:hypothetical protein
MESECPDPSACASDGDCLEGYRYHEWPDPDWNEEGPEDVD